MNLYKQNKPATGKKYSRIATLFTAFVSAVLLASCSNLPSKEESLAAIKSSFNERGIAKLDRLDQTEIQRLCSEANMTGKDVDKKTAEKLQTALYEKIPYPADGKYLGDWREGERIAQNGRGMQFSDAAGAPNDANCYACHQISPTEISFGNQGPSLLKYGAIRQVKDANSKEAEAVVKYTWAPASGTPTSSTSAATCPASAMRYFDRATDKACDGVVAIA